MRILWKTLLLLLGISLIPLLLVTGVSYRAMQATSQGVFTIRT